MRKIVLGLVAAAATLTAGAAMAQPSGSYVEPSGYDYAARQRDSDRDGIPDRAEWGRDRDRDGRPDQWDRYDNRRDHNWREHRRHDRWSSNYRYQGYDGYDRYDRYDGYYRR